MTSRAWLLVGILFALISFSAFAEETIPVQKQAVTILFTPDVCRAPNLPAQASTASELHSQFISIWSVPCSDGLVRSVTSDTSVFNETTGGYFSVNYTVQGQNYSSSQVTVSFTYSCPTTGGWTQVGQSCVRDSCQEGDVRNEQTGACAPPVASCGIPDGSVITGGYYNVGTSSNGAPPASPCLSSCRATFEGDGPYEVVINGVKNYFVKGLYYSTGAVCSPDTPIVDGSTGLPSSSCGPNQSSGTINGRTVCVDNTTNQPVSTDAPKTETKTENTTTNPDGSTTTTTTTNHTDGTSTTETTTTATDGSKTTTVVTNGGESEQPNDGSATELTQKEILEELKKTECEKNPDSFACVTSPLDIVNVDLPESVVNVGITPVSVGGAGACPAGHSYTLHSGQVITMSWELPCQFATGIRPVVLSVAWLSAALLLIGAFRQEG